LISGKAGPGRRINCVDATLFRARAGHGILSAALRVAKARSMYALTKLLELLLAPGNLLVLLLAAGVALQWGQWRRLGLGLSTAAAGLLLVMFLFPIGYWLLQPLEDAYPRPPWPKHVDGVLILGGALNPAVYVSRNAPSEDDVEGRFVAGSELLRRYPNARLIFSGGTGIPGGIAEADVARLALDQLGMDQKRVVYENRSRNTWENILYSQQLAKPKPGEVWLLATSASQLPRAMAIARQLNWPLVPWASDYRTIGEKMPLYILHPDLASNLDTADMALHEWVGLFAYWLMGRARLS
jgi:uncharacterized SAM-binding protein YcdF (DUF218 family)